MSSDPLIRALGLLELQPRRVLRAIAAGAATLGSALALAALSAWLITRAWQMPPVLDLSVAVVAVRALGISRGVFRYLERLATHDTALRGTTAARTRLYQRLAEGDPAAAAGLGRGELLIRTGADVDALGDVVVRAIIPIAVAAVLAIAAVGILAVISPAAALVLAVSLAVAGIAAPALSARAARLAEASSAQARTEFSEAALVALDHAAELRVAGQLEQAVIRAGEAERSAVSAIDRAAVPRAFADAATPLAVGASVLGSLIIGMTAYSVTVTSPMALGILVLLPLSAFEATAALPVAAVALTKARIAARRILALLDAAHVEQTPGGQDLSGPTHLCAQELRSGWPGGRTTVPLDLDLDPGARVAIVGGSGAGKTTTLMTLAGLLPPRSGSVRVNGTELHRVKDSTVRRRIGFFAEDAHLFDTSVFENLRVARGDLQEDEALRTLGSVGLGEWVSGLPEGIHTPLVGGARAVSGGQRRRLLLARALLSPAEVLLLDEPTEHVDAAAGAQLLATLLDRDGGLVASERTVVVVTHQLPPDTCADLVLRLQNAESENALPRA